MKINQKVHFVYLLSCYGAAGKNSVAKAPHKLAPKAQIYASKVGVSFRKTVTGYKSRYPYRKYIKKTHKYYTYFMNPVKRVY